MGEMSGFLTLGAPYAALSGVAAASASVFGKLFSSADPLPAWWLRALYVACMLVSNALVWTLFVRALRASKSSLPVTITSAAVNYCCSAVLGALLFSERTGVLWWLGAVLVLGGLLLINTDSSVTTTPSSPRDTKGQKKD